MALINRVAELLINPTMTWKTIKTESDLGRDLVLRYVFLLALIPSVFGFLGNLLFRGGFLYSLVYSILLLGVFVGSVFVFGFLVCVLAPFFGASNDENTAFKLVAYVSTPVWIAGFLTLIPTLSLPAMLGGFGYAVFLFYTGCQELLAAPKDKALKFSILSIAIWFCMVLVIALAASRIAGLIFAPSILRKQFPSAVILPWKP